MLNVTLSESNPPISIHVAAQMLRDPTLTIDWGKETKVTWKEGSTNQDQTLLRYLSRKNNLLYGTAPLSRTEVDHWMTFARVKLQSPTVPSLEFLNSSLKNGSFLVENKLTLADLAVYEMLRGPNIKELSNYPHILRWFKFIDTTIQDFLPQKLKYEDITSIIEIGNGDDTRSKLKGKQSAKDITGESQTGKGDGGEKTSGNKETSGLGDKKKTDKKKEGAPSKGSGKGDDKNEKPKDEGKFVELPDAEMGKVVVRFPPEASGFLHIGHAKAALLNQYYQQLFQGKLIMRFDDTNPAKENTDFEEAILKDLETLQVKPDEFTYTSNHFDIMLELCEKLIKEGNAYADDTDPETMKNEREARIESKNRANSPVVNLELWKEMKNGTPKGQTCCIRAKINMDSPNGCLRDPTIYRCKNEHHPRTGDKYKVYPTYDFACPIVDSIECVTHALRTTEYLDRDAQYYWFIDILGIRKPYIYSYSRLNLTNTVLSKRKLTWFVDQKLVDGWDDPRFPTVRGILRRGMTVEGLKQFIIAQGSSRSVVVMEWDKIWAFNRKVIDPIVPRHTALTKADRIPVHVEGAQESSHISAAHPKNPDVGKRVVWISPIVWVEESDAVLFKEGDNVTFINWGNLKITKISKSPSGEIIRIDAIPNIENKDFKNTLKITWLAKASNSPLTPVTCVYFEHIISKPVLAKDDDFKKFIGTNTRNTVDMVGDADLKYVKKGDIIQLQRKGFFICDVTYESRSPHSCKENQIILFAIPDGHTKELPTAKVPKQQEKENKNPVGPTNPQAEVNISGDTAGSDIKAQIEEQGAKVRELKGTASKDIVDAEVKILLALKNKYKDATGQPYDPPKAASGKKDIKKENKNPAQQPEKPAKPQAEVNISGNTAESDIKAQIEEQGAKVRELKGTASKDIVDAEVKVLLALKDKYKNTTGQPYDPPKAASGKKDIKKENKNLAQQPEIPVQPAKPQVEVNISGNTAGSDIKAQIEEQGAKVRELKGTASKDIVDAEVKLLLALKDKYKEATGQPYDPPKAASEKNEIKKENKNPAQQPEKPGQTAKPQAEGNMSDNIAGSDIRTQIEEQGAKVRELKGTASKDIVDAEVKLLLALKDKYKEATGQPYDPPKAASGKKDVKKENKKPAQQPTKAAQPTKPLADVESSNPNLKKLTRLGLEAMKSENLSDWFTQVITKSEMIEYYDVSGCYILRPWSYAIWEAIQKWFDAEIKKLGVSNAYFPMFVSQAALEKEKDHIADFAPEVAWVTRSGNTEMAEPIAIRPTSETIMYPAFAKWVQSYRDLPIKINQWNNVVRWEFKHPQPFLRTREFLWQEGHTAFATYKEADEEVYQILNLYEKVYTDLLAIPVIPGRKTEKEKFPGGDFTTTVEAFVSASGRGLQGATSHHLGQNFSKMFEIVFDDPETHEKVFAYQNSWGLSTRTIGAMVMVHSDDQGIVLPPRVACIQVIIIPCGITATLSTEDRNSLYDVCKVYEETLIKAGVRAKADLRDNYSPGWKYNHWELKGVPIRVDIGPRDLKEQKYVAVRRDNGVKAELKQVTLAADLCNLLDAIHKSLFDKANEELQSHITVTEDWETFCNDLDRKHIIMSPFCGGIECEDTIKKDSAKEEVELELKATMGAKSLCIPFKQPKEVNASTKCINKKCTTMAKNYTLFGRSY